MENWMQKSKTESKNKAECEKGEMECRKEREVIAKFKKKNSDFQIVPSNRH